MAGPWDCKGLQISRLEQLQVERNLALVCKALPALPQAPSTPCARAWRTPPASCPASALLERIGKEQECAEPDPETLAYLCRALASCRATDCAPTSC